MKRRTALRWGIGGAVAATVGVVDPLPSMVATTERMSGGLGNFVGTTAVTRGREVVIDPGEHMNEGRREVVNVSLPVEEYAAFVELVEDADVFSLDDDYPGGLSDTPRRDLAFVIDGRRREIDLGQGVRTASLDPILTRLETYRDRYYYGE